MALSAGVTQMPSGRPFSSAADWAKGASGAGSGDSASNLVQLYAALGGGWSDGEQQVPLDAFPYWP